MRFLFILFFALLCSPALAQPKVTVLDNGWLAVDGKTIYPDCFLHFNYNSYKKYDFFVLNNCIAQPEEERFVEKIDYTVLGNYQDKYILDITHTTGVGSMDYLVDIEFNWNSEGSQNSSIKLTHIYYESGFPSDVNIASSKWDGQYLSFKENVNMVFYLSNLGINVDNPLTEGEWMTFNDARADAIAIYHYRALPGNNPELIKTDIKTGWLSDDVVFDPASVHPLEKCVRDVNKIWIMEHGNFIFTAEEKDFIKNLFLNCGRFIPPQAPDDVDHREELNYLRFR